MKQFIIAHISDIHLPLDNVPFSAFDLLNKRFLSYLSWKNRRLFHKKAILDLVIQDMIKSHPDLVAISGDLTNLALPGEFKHAAQWLNQLPFPNIHVIPGNHDALIKTKWHQNDALWTPWTKAYQADDYPIVHRIGPVALIALNSGLPTPPFFARGHVNFLQLQRLKYVLQQTKVEKLCRIIMLHHPPVSGLVPERKALKDRDDLQKVILDEGAEMILYGHVHKTITKRFLHTSIPMLGISSASSCSSRYDRQAAWRKIVVTPTSEGWNLQTVARTINKDHQFTDMHAFSLDINRMANQ